VTDVMRARAMAAQKASVFDRIDDEHMVHQHGTIARADSTSHWFFDEVAVSGLAHVLGARGSWLSATYASARAGTNACNRQAAAIRSESKSGTGGFLPS